MKRLLFALFLSIVLANEHVFEFDGDKPTTEQIDDGWLGKCTVQIIDTGCDGCECTEVDGHKVTVTGTEDNLDDLEDHLEDESIEIDGKKYELVAEDSDEVDPFMALASCIGMLSVMMGMIICFFACKTWPNTPELIEERRILREKEEKEKLDDERRKKEEDAMFSV